MEDIALFVLPNMDEEEETGGSKASKASIQVAKLKSKGETSDAEAEESSLGFSETRNHGQAPAELAKILNNEEIAQGGSYGNSLQAASYASDEKAVQALLDKGAKARSLNTEAFDFESGVDEDEVRDTDFDPLPATTFEDVTGGTDGQELQARGDGVVMENAGDEAIAAAYTVEKAEQEAKAKAKEEEEKKAAEDAAKLLAAAKKAREEVEEKTAEEAKAATEAHGKALAEVAAAAEEPAQPPGPMPPGPLPPPSLGGEPWTPLNMPRREPSKGKGRAGKILGDGPIRLPPPPPQIIDVGSPPSPMVDILSPMPPGPMPVPKPAKAKPKPHPNVGFLRWTAGGAVRPAGKRGKTSETPTSSGGDATSPGATTQDEDSQHSNNAKAS
ncbi:Tpr repeat protein oca3 protein [Lasiodiplodia theobromae]|uniref:Tpr repeat protein oca3 protein n=1 Tax=Lasiodiplodia theobromae TaxID=45133 RepID=UPI0015C3508B|nr:Tpr repeat protein oca3 protein [Lasiodiplodia theobromae]KAF4536850.1 Tpr repeat protein oca3 protein [Lasiodiplodia theobromae]